jgi:hypothetical protein
MEKELHDLMMELEGKERIMAEQTSRLFNINNTLFPDNKEWTKGCPDCRERVYKRLKSYWENNIRQKYI